MVFEFRVCSIEVAVAVVPVVAFFHFLLVDGLVRD